MDYDHNNHPFEQVGDLRITYVEKHRKQPSSTDRLKIEAVGEDHRGSAFLALEIPLASPDQLLPLLETITRLYRYESVKQAHDNEFIREFEKPEH